MTLLQSWRKHFRDQTDDINVVGIGIAPFMKIAPAFLLPHFRLVCLRASRDLPLLRERMTIDALQEHDIGVILPANNTAEVLKHPWTQQLLASMAPPIHVLVYKGTDEVCALAEQYGWKLIANPSSVRTQFELKGMFPLFCEEAGITPLPYELIPTRELTPERLRTLQTRFGHTVVLQAAEVETAGGTTTGFIRSPEELAEFTTRRMKLDPEGLRKIKATRYVTGEAASILACVTRRGVVTSVVQNQILDRPELFRTEKGQGAFCGHDWTAARFSASVQARASTLAKAFGAVMATRGYRGVFGMDIIITPEDEVIPIECNARYTGAFPMISLLQMSGGVAPLDAYHVAEFLDVEWEWDLDEAERELQRPMTGGHLVLSNTLDTPGVIRGDVLPGVYRLSGDGIEFLRPGYSYEHITSPGEFALVSGIPSPGHVVPSGTGFSRMCHILAREPLVLKSGALTDWAATVATRVRAAFDLEPVSEGSPEGTAEV